MFWTSRGGTTLFYGSVLDGFVLEEFVLDGSMLDGSMLDGAVLDEAAAVRPQPLQSVLSRLGLF